jgi:hypothetical protein
MTSIPRPESPAPERGSTEVIAYLHSTTIIVSDQERALDF